MVVAHGKEFAYNAGDPGLIPGSGRCPGDRAWQPIPVFLSGELHERRSLVVYSPWGRKDSGREPCWIVQETGSSC